MWSTRSNIYHFSFKIFFFQIGSFPIDGSGFVLDVEKIVLPNGFKLPSVCPNDLACSICRGGSENITISPLMYV